MLAGPISYLLASDAFDAALGDVLRESIPDSLPARGNKNDPSGSVVNRSEGSVGPDQSALSLTVRSQSAVRGSWACAAHAKAGCTGCATSSARHSTKTRTSRQGTLSWAARASTS